ncbi:hypothetical protein J2Z22_002157 [Paenibacillus forsythiae]|uniref:Uncharacterized protein n=1 Tax=Paenibacillus forsythiae TaxID=365616 RepID=A0ABU3H852_9BACL|nr:hypothetical protein [Paenibacillus forsythiae]
MTKVYICVKILSIYPMVYFVKLPILVTSGGQEKKRHWRIARPVNHRPYESNGLSLNFTA